MPPRPRQHDTIGARSWRRSSRRFSVQPISAVPRCRRRRRSCVRDEVGGVRVLVLDGNENQAVASVRSLARAGHTVDVGADTSWSKAGLSRGARSSFTYPAPQRDACGFVKAIAGAAAAERGTLVMPMTERTTLPLSAERERLAAVGAQVVLPDHQTVLRA